MTKTLKKILSRGASGTGIGNIISMLVALVSGIAGKNPQMTIYDYAKYTCAATVIGFAFAAASLLFESERISEGDGAALSLPRGGILSLRAAGGLVRFQARGAGGLLCRICGRLRMYVAGDLFRHESACKASERGTEVAEKRTLRNGAP